MRPVAITREVSPDLRTCQLTHHPRVPIDLELARAQHHAYEQALDEAGYAVQRLASEPGMADSVFVEDTALIFDELAIITRPGAESRRSEVFAVARVLARYRPVQFIVEPGIMDGGDVLLVGRQVFVGRSSRTNVDAIEQLRMVLRPHGYTVAEVPFHGCLHLKSAATLVEDSVLLVNPAWIDSEAFSGVACIAVDPQEPLAANALRLRDRIIFPSEFPRTAERLRDKGLRLQTVDASELAKAEGAVTCCSLIVPCAVLGGGPPARGSERDGALERQQ